MKTKPANGVEQIKLEKGIPLPRPRACSGLAKALDDMQVGDSFRIERTKYASVRTLAQLRSKSIRTRKDGEGYIRVWRIA